MKEQDLFQTWKAGSILRRIYYESPWADRLRNLLFRRVKVHIQVEDYVALQQRCSAQEHYDDREKIAVCAGKLAGFIKNRYGARWPEIEIIDIGTRDGWTVELFVDLGFQNACGVELISDYVEHANKRGRRVVTGAGEKLPFPSASIDFCFSRHTLEHAQSPHSFIKELWRICKPGGYVALVFPMQRRPIGKHCTAIPSFAGFRNLLKTALPGEKMDVVYLGRSQKVGFIEEGVEALFLAQKVMNGRTH